MRAWPGREAQNVLATLCRINGCIRGPRRTAQLLQAFRSHDHNDIKVFFGGVVEEALLVGIVFRCSYGALVPYHQQPGEFFGTNDPPATPASVAGWILEWDLAVRLYFAFGIAVATMIAFP